MAVNIQALSVELKKPQYTGLSDAAAADLVNQQTRIVKKPFTQYEALRYCYRKNIWGKIRFLSIESDASYSAPALTWCDILTAPYEVLFNLDDPEVANAMNLVLTALVSAQAITAQNKTDLLALQNKTVWYWETIGDQPVAAEHVKQARALPAVKVLPAKKKVRPA